MQMTTLGRTPWFSTSRGVEPPVKHLGFAGLRFKRSVSGGAVRCGALDARNVGAPAHDKLVVELKEWLEVNHPELPVGRYGIDDHELLVWFLKDRRYNVQEAAQKLANFIRWRDEFGVGKITDESISKISSSGKAYLHTHPDINGRPVLVVVAAKHSPLEEEVLESQKLCVYLVERALERLPPGNDQILGIFDLRGFNTSNADFNFVRFLIDVFYRYYPKRLAQVLFVDAPFIFQPGWSLVKPLLKSYSNLVRFCSVEVVRKEYFTEDTLPSDFKR